MQWIKVSKLTALDKTIETRIKNNKTNIPTFTLHTFLINLKLLLKRLKINITSDETNTTLSQRLHHPYFPNVYDFYYFII